MTTAPEGATPALQLTVLCAGFSHAAATADPENAEQALGHLLRTLPALYASLFDLDPYDEGLLADVESYDTGAINQIVDEEQYTAVQSLWASILGHNDVYLDTQVEDMRYSDTPVGVSLSEQIADIFQVTADFAATMADAPTDAVPEILADIKYRFHSYLSDTICAAQRAANNIYQSKALRNEE